MIASELHCSTSFSVLTSSITLQACPNDKDAQEKYKECEKIVRKIAFEKAISVDGSAKPLVEVVRSSLDSIGL